MVTAVRPSVTQLFQLGVETTKGVPVAATRKMQAMKVIPHPMTVMEEFVASGFKFPTVVAVNEEWTEFDVSGPVTYNELAYPLASLLTAPVDSTLAAGIYQHVITPNSGSPDSGKTFTAEFGDTNYAERVSGGQFVDGTLTFARKASDFKGRMIGVNLDLSAPITQGPAASEVQTITISGTPTGGTWTLSWYGTVITLAFNVTTTALQTALQAIQSIGTGNVTVTGTAGASYVLTFAGALANTFLDLAVVDGSGLTGGTTPAASIAMTTAGSGAAPTVLTMEPVVGNQLDVFMDTSFGALGTTKLLNEFQLVWALTGKVGPYWPMNTGNPSYGGTVELLPKSSVKLLLEADAQGRQILTNMRAGQIMYTRLQALGPSLGSGHRQTLQVDMCLKANTPDPYADNEGLVAAGFTCSLVADPTAGFATRVTFINDLASL